MGLIALFDVGKTNSKLSLIDCDTGKRTFSAERANKVLRGSLGKQLDVQAIEEWLVRTLAAAPNTQEVIAIVPVAHGAACVLLDAKGEVLAACDYEDPQFDAVAALYRPSRDAFTSTYSPDLPLGLNLGRQLFFLQHRHAELFVRAEHVLLYPQYWAWRMSGIMASEVSSLGCHSDLWRPAERTFSALAREQGWAKLFPSIRFAGDTLGTITPSFAAATGLPLSCRTICGVHDSNASYLKFLLGREKKRFTVVSSGTWTIVMSNGGDLARLREERDMLANVDVFGSAVPTARYMGGREYEAIAQGRHEPEFAALESIVRKGVFARPAFAAGGPFASRPGEIIGPEDLASAERAALATLYSVMMTHLLIDSVGAGSDVFVDGPFAKQQWFNRLLAAADSSRSVYVSATDELAPICFLAGANLPQSAAAQRTSPIQLLGFEEYCARWRELVHR
jgi:sugar (pentulose or hexulose) kinase